MRNIKILSLIIFLILWLEISIFSQERLTASCISREIWIIRDSESFPLGKCENKNWTGVIEPVSAAEYLKHKPSLHEKQLTAALKQFNKSNRQSAERLRRPPVEAQTLVKINDKSENIVFPADQFDSLDKLFQSSQSKNKEMEFEIFIGAADTDKKTNKINIISETARFTVKVKGSNPTIGEVLEEVKKEIDKIKKIQYLKDYFYLERWRTWKKLDIQKTVKDYGLKSGDLLYAKPSIR